MNRFSVIYGLLLAALVFTGCAQDKKERAGIDPKAQSQASPQIEESFGVKNISPSAVGASAQNVQAAKYTGAGLSVDKAHVIVQKAALGKEFLLSVNLLLQTPTPSFSGLQSRVVSFILRDKKVYLLDVTKNNVVAAENNIPQSLLIAEFSILAETDEALEIDFNSGMNQIFVVDDMFTSDNADFNGAKYKLPAAQVQISYLDEVTLTSSSTLFIRQIAQINSESKIRPVEVRYQIKPYLPDSGFIPVKSPGFDKVGYFEANPLLLADGSTRVYAMKWNEKKSIQFAISANTPEKYRGLIKSALLYWNKILGENAIKVTQLTDKTQTAPYFDLNIIQWVDWDSANSAFADAHVDPRSGEVTSAQIFFPSSFMQNTVPQRVRLTEASRQVVGLKGFKSATLCKRDLARDFLQREKSAEVSAEAQEKAVRDFAYEVIAHEMGHVLGLRHNFAASLAANYDYKDRKNLIMSYYKNMKAPEGVVASNSVMEYSKFEESSWNGDLLQRGSKALAYDEMAIKHLYFKTPIPLTERPIFCTDSDTQFYVDCNADDAGRSIVSASSGAYQSGLHSLAAQLMNTYISNSKQAGDMGTDLIPVAEVSLNAQGQAEDLVENLGKLVSLLKENTRFIAVRSRHMPVLSTTKSEIEKLEKNYLQTEFARLGGLESLTKEISEQFDTELVSQFSELLEDPLYNSGVLPDGTRYSFSSEEKEIMKKQVAVFAVQIKEQLILNEIKALSGESSDEKQSWADSDLAYELSQVAFKRFALYAATKTTDKLKSEVALKDGSRTFVELPVYRYSQKIRLAAIDLLLSRHKVVDIGYLVKKDATKLLTADMLLLGDEEKIDMSSFDRETLQWYLNNKKLLSSLM